MPPLNRGTRNRAERRDAVRHKLIDEVEAMLEEGTSFGAIKVDQLAARAGISRAGFYIHFQDKVELLESWLTETRKVLLDASDTWYRASPSLSRAELREAIGTIVRAYRERMTLMAAMHETALYDATLREDFAAAFEKHVSALAAHIKAGQKSGDIPKALHARETAEWLVCLLERPPMWIPRSASKREVALHADAATDIIWNTLYSN